jgi:hypothetical protein
MINLLLGLTWFYRKFFFTHSGTQLSKHIHRKSFLLRFSPLLLPKCRRTHRDKEGRGRVIEPRLASGIKPTNVIIYCKSFSQRILYYLLKQQDYTGTFVARGGRFDEKPLPSHLTPYK